MNQIPKYIEIIIDVLSRCSEPEKDAELRFDMLSMLDYIVDSPFIQDSIKNFSKEIAKVIPSLAESSHPVYALEIRKAKHQDQKSRNPHLLQGFDQKSLPSGGTSLSLR